MTYVLGLTGSIGMGKTTTAAMFHARGLPVWDADKTVEHLYRKGQAAYEEIAKHYPDAVDEISVSKSKLRALIAKDPKVLDHVQSVVHPLVARDREQFVQETDADIIVLDIPLLFESGAADLCDGVVVVTAPASVQKERVLSRGEMSEAEFAMILARQMPDAEKRRRATWVLETISIEAAEAKVESIIADIRKDLGLA